MKDDADLMDIRMAAALLHVSESSLRRWTNAGLLPSFRVGGRRERRFRRSDLLAFMESHAGPGQPVAAEARSPVMGHLCGFYSSETGRERQAAGFLADGLVNGMRCFLSATPPVRDVVLSALKEHHPEGYGRARELLVPMEYLDAREAQLALWEGRLSAAGRDGSRVMRVLGDVSGGRLSDSVSFEELLRYESEYERRIARRFPVSTLCLYDARELSGVQASQMLNEHPDTLRYPVAG